MYRIVNQCRVELGVRFQCLSGRFQHKVVERRCNAVSIPPRIRICRSSSLESGEIDLDSLCDMRCLRPNRSQDAPAVVRRMPASGVTSTPAAGASGCAAVLGAGASLGAFTGVAVPSSIARCTSSLVTRPPGPVPCNTSASTPCRCASRWATGVTRDLTGCAAVGASGCATALGCWVPH